MILIVVSWEAALLEYFVFSMWQKCGSKLFGRCQNRATYANTEVWEKIENTIWKVYKNYRIFDAFDLEVEESDDGWRIWFEIFEEKEVLALLIHDIFTSVNLDLLIDKSDLNVEESFPSIVMHFSIVYNSEMHTSIFWQPPSRSY